MDTGKTTGFKRLIESVRYIYNTMSKELTILDSKMTDLWYM